MAGNDLQITDADLEVARESVRRGVHGVIPALVAVIGFAGFFGGAIAAVIVARDHVLAIAIGTGVFTVAIGVPVAMTISEIMKRRGLAIGAEQAVQQRLLETEARRREFETRLGRALEMADDERAAYDVISRAMSSAIGEQPVELLLADNSHAHLNRVVAVDVGATPAPGCPVEAPDRCVAARRAQTQVFADSEALDACPLLRVADHGRCSAVCVPVSIMGTTVGVMHTVGEVGAPLHHEEVGALQALANLAGNRLGMLRVMAKTQLQASTDGLTGLINRRSLENQARELRAEGADFAVVVADLDHFKRLNDTHGHDTGDRALRVFAESLRVALRADDVACRYGGEEFVILLPRADVDEAVEVSMRVMEALAHRTNRGDVPTFTASFGVAHSADAQDFEGVVHCADRALFQAKQSGRNRVCVDGRTPPPPLKSVDGATVSH